MSLTIPPRALARGEDIVLISDEPRNLAQRIFDRVTTKPDGIIRSYATDGLHRADTYSSLWRRAGDIAAALSSAGAKPSCTVIILVEDILDFLPAFWACLRGGFLAVALTNAAKDFLYRDDGAFGSALELLNDRFFLVDELFEGETKLSEAFSGLGPFVHLSTVGPAPSWTDHTGVQDPACLVATSGSTGALKLVALTHATLIFRNYARTKVFDTDARNAIGTFPLDGITGQHAIYLHYDSWTQLSSETITRKPCAILDAIETFEGGVISLTGSMVNIILDADGREPRSRQLGCIKLIAVGAEPIAVKSMQEFSERLHRYGASTHVLKAGYGTTETGSLVKGSKKFRDAEIHDAVCLGPPFAGVKMRIVDDQGKVLEEGATGKLEVFCPEKLFSSYWGNSDLTRDGFAPDGWWKTGDMGHIVENQLFLRGRAKDILILRGKKFSLADIDAELRGALNPSDSAYSCVVAGDGGESLAVVFAVGDFARSAHVQQEIKDALARRFGIHPSRLMRIDSDRFPKTASGKIRRNLLGALLAADPVGESDRHLLENIWNTALGQEGPVHTDADFFEQGGDSLRSLTMHIQILDAFQVNISSDLFFANPTFDNLFQLLRSSRLAGSEKDNEVAIRWRLPIKLENGLLAALETWPGERPTISRLVIGHHPRGSKPPSFWVLNTEPEPAQLASALGSEQPLYAFRSGVGVSDYNENDIQAFALRYISEIEEICPNGPFFIGGHCQGAIIALAMAQHARRRKRHVPLLILTDWASELQPYPGRVLLVAGRNPHLNVRRRFAMPELAWHRAFGAFEFAEISGSYALDREATEELGNVLRGHMHSSLSAPTALLPTDAYHATIVVEQLPGSMEVGSRREIRINVRNDSEQAWQGTDLSGLTVGVRWTDSDGDVISAFNAAARLPNIDSHASVPIVFDIIAPEEQGYFRLHIDVCEQGNRWFNVDPAKAFTAPIRVDRRPRALTTLSDRPRRWRGQYSFNLKSKTLHLLVSGWSGPEDWGTWSVGQSAKLRLPLRGLKGRWCATLSLKAFGRPDGQMPVQVKAGYEGETFDWKLPANIVVEKQIDLNCMGDDITLQFRFPEVASPLELGISADYRKLGLGLIAMRLKRFPSPAATGD